MLAVFPVSNLNDVGSGSLRDAINRANALGGADRIEILIAGSIRIHSQLPRIIDSVTIVGLGPDTSTIDAGHGVDGVPASGDGWRIFDVDNGTLSHTLDVEIAGMTLTGGDAFEVGGAVRNTESLIVRNSRIINNATASSGGGIYARWAVTIASSVVAENLAGDYGGGVASDLGPLSISASSLSGNTAVSQGGAIDKRAGDVTLTDVTISRNFAGSYGGGVALRQSTATISGAYVSNNTSASDGGGLSAIGTSLTLNFSNVTGNSANNGGGLHHYNGFSQIAYSSISDNTASGRGGGVDHIASYGSSNFAITSSVISGNKALGSGGGLYLWSTIPKTFSIRHSTLTENTSSRIGGGVQIGNGTLAVDHSILAKNTATVGPDAAGVIGTTIQADYSLIGVNGATGLAEAPVGSPDARGNLIGGTVHGAIDPVLKLGESGGAGKSFELLPTSPALNAGKPTAVAGVGNVPNKDGRGYFGRIANGRIDVGAYERQSQGALALTVDTLSDAVNGNYGAGDLSLREAIGISNGNLGTADSISFAPALTALGSRVIELSRGEMTIGGSLAIAGPGADRLTLDVSASDPTPEVNNADGSRIFLIDDGDVIPNSTVSISDLTLTGGDVFENGGAIFSREKTTIVRSRISGNATRFSGGGVYARGAGGFLEVQSSVIEGNHAFRMGGGVGAIMYSGGRVLIANSTISHNVASMGNTFEVARGGGLAFHISANMDAQFEVISSTISGNSAGGDGGGLYHGLGTLKVRASTIVDNFSTSAGGGIGTQSGRLDITVDHSIVARNESTQGSDDIAARPNLNYSLVGNGNGMLPGFVVGSLVGTAGDPINSLLGPLAANGGWTQTHALLPGSPAINAGDPGFAGPEVYDQRGADFARVRQARVDIGAYEAQVMPSGDFNGDGQMNGTDFLAWQRGLGAANATRAMGNGDDDSDVDASDLALWRVSFVQAGPVGAVALATDAPSQRGAKSRAIDAEIIWAASAAFSTDAASIKGDGDGTSMQPKADPAAGVGPAIQVDLAFGRAPDYFGQSYWGKSKNGSTSLSADASAGANSERLIDELFAAFDLYGLRTVK